MLDERSFNGITEEAMILYKSIYVLIAMIIILAVAPGYCLTISGKVYLDQNSDGIFQENDIGIQNTAISDGRTVVLTDKSGNYRIDTESGKMLFVSLPSGFRSVGNFYKTATDTSSIDFPMSIWNETKSDTFRFVQITDLHITNKDTVDIFVKDMAEISEMNPKPAFVIASGDMVNIGDNASEFDSLMDAFSKVSLPVFRGIGNHEVVFKIGHANYRKYCGPEYYSFNAGKIHFIMLDCLNFNDAQKKWLNKDLAAAPKGYQRIFIQHYLPTRENMILFKELNASAVFSGHWHGNRTDDNFGVLNLNTPPFRFAGIDRTPASFRVADVLKNKLKTELRFTGHKQMLTVVSPSGDIPATNGKIQILANIYDTWNEVDRAECFINGREFSLEKKSSWSWMGEIDAADVSDYEDQYLTVTAYDKNEKQWSDVSKFKLVKSNKVKPGDDWPQWLGGNTNTRSSLDTIHPPLSMAWMANTGGMVGLSSPVLSKDILAIGVTGTSDLKKCGIAAFNAKTGEQRWHYQTDSAIKGQVAIDDGQVFAVSISGFLYYIDLKSGRLIWKNELNRQIERWEISSPAVSNGVVYTGNAAYLGAFNTKTGKPQWERSLHTSTDNNGEKIWPGQHFGVWSDWIPSNYSVLTLSKEKIIIPTIHGLFTIGKSTGEPARISTGNTRGGVISNDVFYTIKSGVLTAIDLASGKTLWTGKVNLGDCASVPALSDNRIIAGSGDGRICAFSTKDGSLLWSYQTGRAISDMMPYVRGKSDVNSSPAISGNTVYVGSSDGNLYAISLATGEKLWDYSLGVPIASSPIISGNTLFIAAYDGTVYAFIESHR